RSGFRPGTRPRTRGSRWRWPARNVQQLPRGRGANARAGNCTRRTRYGPDLDTGYADGLTALLAVPRFPGMVWVEERLPGGEAVAVGIAEGPTAPLAYLFPADRTHPVTVRRQTPGGVQSVTLQWYTPRG